MPVVAWGGGSGTQGGAVAINGGLVVDLRGLDTIVEIDDVSMTVTAQAGVNGNVLERALNERGLMLPHYPASSEWATVGGYVAARGSGVLSTRYGKIEDLVLGLRVALPNGTLFDSVPAPRHAVGPDLTQLFVGSEGTLGIITRATLEVVPLPAERSFVTLHFPSVEAGVTAFRTALARGNRPSVIRMYDEEGTRRTLSPVLGVPLDGVMAIVVFEGGESRLVAAERAATIELARSEGARELDPALAETWWDRRYDFYKPPHHPELPAIWGTIDVVASYARIHAVHQALKTAVRDRYAPEGLQLRMHFSHWYRWGTMIYARFLIPGRRSGPARPARPDLGRRRDRRPGGRRRDERPPRRGPEAGALHARTTRTWPSGLALGEVRVRSSRHHESRQARPLRRRPRRSRRRGSSGDQGVDAQLDAAGADRAHDRAARRASATTGSRSRVSRSSTTWRTCAACWRSTGSSAGAR